MLLTDTHTHLYLEQFSEDIEEVIERALDYKVQRFFFPNIDRGTTAQLLKLCKKFPDHCFPMMGLHPCSVKEDYEDELSHVYEELKTGKYCAVGEIGIDLYWDKTFTKEQEIAFRKQIEWAKEFALPIVIHARESFQEIFSVMDDMNDDRLTGIFHCFTGTYEDAKKILGYGGFKLGIGGVVTFKNSGLDKVVAQLNPKDLVLETDSPYLAPTPYRGKRNESSYVVRVAEKLADIFELSLEEIAEITTQNSKDVFKI